MHVGIAKPESLKSVAALTIGSAEEVFGACSLTDGLFEYVTFLKPWQVQVALHILPQGHRIDGDLAIFPVKLLEGLAQMDRRPSADNQLIVMAHALDFSA